MAAMAPALTDAPAEARHIRFKLASPSSNLSPSSPENNSNASNILLSASVSAPAASTNGKHLVTDHEENCHPYKAQEQSLCADTLPVCKPPSLGKLQPLVASYLCSDVTPVPSSTKAKESLKQQGVLIKQSVLKSHGLLSGSIFHSSTAGTDFLLRKHHALELTGGQLKSLVNGGGGGGGGGDAAMVPVNGLAKKVGVPATTAAEKGCVTTVNGNSDKPSANQEAPLSPPTLSSKSSVTMTTATKQKGDVKQQFVAVANQNSSSDMALTGSSQSPRVNSELSTVPCAGQVLPVSDEKATETSNCSDMDTEENKISPLPVLSSSPAPQRSSPPSSPCLEMRLHERTLQNQRRQAEIEGRLCRLRKRLQVVQAKQVERHVQQQLNGFLDTALSKTSKGPSHKVDSGSWRGIRASGDHQAGSLARFLKGSSVPSELERLSLSGSANLHSAEAAFDSDATESSSGGDSDVEEEELARVDLEQRHIKLWRRAEGRHALERASIISHWTWLQAHISDLEYRIRQQTDIYRQIRAGKGCVELGDSPPCFGTTETDAEPETDPLPLQTSHDSTEEPGQPGGCLTDRPVNGVPNSSVADGSDVKCPLMPDNTCVAARTRPLLSCRRRRLVHPNTITNLSSKVHKASCSPPPACEVNSSCMMCGGRQHFAKQNLPYDRPLLERLAHQDPSVHPILSLQSDVGMSVHLQRVLKSHWQSTHTEKLKPLKKLSLRHKLSLSSSSLSSPSSSKHRFKLSSCHRAAVRLSHHKSRLERSHRQTDVSMCVPKSENCTPYRAEHLQDRSHSRKRAREHSFDRTESPKLLVDTGSPCSSLSSLHSSTPSPLNKQLANPSESPTPLSNSGQTPCSMQPIRRRRGESSFDINNIVIPMSVVATTRVEKLQYKEILTPSWREADVLAQPIAEEDDNAEVEDLSDAAFSQLHQPYEEQERSRWRWTALTPAKRRGSRSYKSVDGRTTPSLGGTNPSTPQPSSPDAGHFQVLQDYAAVCSPLSPASPDTPGSRDGHSSRDAHRLLSSEDTRSSTPDCIYEERTVQPWERRTFPLSEDPVAEPKESAKLDWDPNQRYSSNGREGHTRAESESEAPSP
ncbi:KAT8 regulatory NSL complex subunit 1 [Chanos chanos]|uniref:KAT8 regulatory NSL complex subunit 1 n=1 Tax=Chanos chanos TaxID=29144 RepID=A0A6J2VC30_CHACN|nr:KAT8 regulatory NSL complex subunit 1-like [Chanos chanos]